jgi:hypothetical protein
MLIRNTILYFNFNILYYIGYYMSSTKYSVQTMYVIYNTYIHNDMYIIFIIHSFNKLYVIVMQYINLSQIISFYSKSK